MEFLTNIAGYWGQTLLVGAVIYLIALVGIAITTILTYKEHLISAAIAVLVSAFIARISKITIVIGMILAVLKVILNFI